MEISTRRILKEDVVRINELTQQLGYSLTLEQTQENIIAVTENKDHDAYVAVIDKKVIGWIGLAHSIQIELPSYCEIRGLVVDDEYRNHGVGKMLIEKARQWALENGIDKLRLRCNVKRTATHLFYQHLSFKEIKEQKVFELNI